MVNFYTVKEVASYLGVSEKWVYRHRDLVPGHFKLGSLLLFDRRILEEEIAKRAKQSAKPVTKGGASNHGL
jgi:excisionase family DNA binding protein